MSELVVVVVNLNDLSLRKTLKDKILRYNQAPKP